MEWMLQVVDEIDDTLIAARQRCENVLVELGHLPLAVAGIVAISGALWLGADPTLISGATASATFAAVLRAKRLAP